uniref:AAA+ ATPase domain-containing protein n=1 Tax=Bionectria ochroleuca TaxID=29856 RepID=A0A8H7NHZ8_BIOOC
MGGHNVVIARPLDVGPGQAQSITEALRRKFTKVALFLVVGICGAVPFFPVQPDPEHVVRRIILGDVIISSSIAQYLYRGQARPDGFQMRNILNGSGWAMQPSPRARALAQALEGPNWLEIAEANMLDNLVQLQENRHGAYMYPGAERDKLYQASYVHKHHEAQGCACAKYEHETCDGAMRTPCQDICDEDLLIIDGESQQRGGSPNIYLGAMASGDIIMRSGELRDKISREQEVIAFEMEGAGVQIGSSSCLVIKAACDYADSHKKKDFQEYAAGVAASAAKAVLQWYTPEPEDDETDRVYVENVIFRSFSPAATWSDDRGLLKTMAEHCFDKPERLPKRGTVLLIQGSHGLGKTELCRVFAKRFRSRYHAVWMINAGTAFDLELGLRNIASEDLNIALNTQGSMQSETDDLIGLIGIVKAQLENEKRPWLLILDGYNDTANYNITHYLPSKATQPYFSEHHSHLGTIIITTTDASLRLQLGENSISVNSLSVDEATRIFKHEIRPIPDAAVIDNLVGDILAKLQLHPVAIKIAAGIIQKRRSTQHIHKALENLLGNLSTDILSPRTEVEDILRGVWRPWEISVAKLRREEAKHPTGSLDLLELLSFLDGNGLSCKAAEAAWAATKTNPTSFSNKGLSCFMQGSQWEESSFHKAVEILANARLVNVLATGDDVIVSMEPLVSLCAYNYFFDTLEDKTSAWIRAMATIAIMAPTGFTDRDRASRRGLAPHVKSCLARSLGYKLLWTAYDLSPATDIVLVLAMILFENGLAENAKSLLSKLLDQLLRTDGRVDKIKALNVKMFLATTLHDMGDRSQALTLRREVVEACQQQRGKAGLGGEAEWRYLHAASALAESLSLLPERRVEAANLLRDVHDMAALISPPGKVSVALLRTKSRLAKVLYQLGAYRHAFDLRDEVVNILNGEPNMKSVQYNMEAKEELAQSLSKMGRLIEALKLREAIHEFRVATLPPSHPETSLASINLTISFENINSSTIATSLSTWKNIYHAEETLSKALGEHHVMTLRAKSNIARIYLARKDYESAFQKVSEVRRIMASQGAKLVGKQMGYYDQDMLDCDRLHAELLLRRWTEADKRDALMLWRQIAKRLGHQNAGTRQVSYAILRVARCYIKRNELDNAEAKVEEASRLPQDGFYDNTLDCKVLQADILERRADACDLSDSSNSGSEDDQKQEIKPNGGYVPEDRNTRFRYVWSCQNDNCKHIAGQPYIMEACYCRFSRRRAGRMVCCCCHYYMRFGSLESDDSCSYETDSSSCSSADEDGYFSLEEIFRCYNRQCRKPRHTCVRAKGSQLKDIMPSKVGCFCRPSVSLPNAMLCCHCHKPMIAVSRHKRWSWGVASSSKVPDDWDSPSDLGTNCPSGSDEFSSVIDPNDLPEPTPSDVDHGDDESQDSQRQFILPY